MFKEPKGEANCGGIGYLWHLLSQLQADVGKGRQQRGLASPSAPAFRAMSFLCWPTVCVSCDLFISNCGCSYILLHGTLLKIASVPLLLILAAQNWQLPNDALALNQRARLRRGGSIAMMISVGREARARRHSASLRIH